MLRVTRLRAPKRRARTCPIAFLAALLCADAPCDGDGLLPPAGAGDSSACTACWPGSFSSASGACSSAPGAFHLDAAPIMLTSCSVALRQATHARVYQVPHRAQVVFGIGRACLCPPRLSLDGRVFRLPLIHRPTQSQALPAPAPAPRAGAGRTRPRQVQPRDSGRECSSVTDRHSHSLPAPYHGLTADALSDQTMA